MGNVTAGGVNDGEDDENEYYEDGTETSPSSGEITDGALDLSVLFDHGLLREAASKIKEEPNESFMQQHSGSIIRWLEERNSRHEEYVSLSQFTDMLTGRGASKEECIELFSQFDADGEGFADVETFLETLQTLGGGLSAKGDLRTSIKTLQNCCLTPGFLDAFADNKEAVMNHGQKLLKFLLRNRASSTSLPLPALDGFCNTSEMRLKVLQAHIEALKEKAEVKKQVPSVEEGEVLRPLMKCYMTLEVSSNKGDISRLTNGDASSYWQSDGPARSHWIRLRMRPNVVLKQLSINVGSSDQSYMPQHVVVTAGRDEQNLREISDCRIPSQVNGDFVLVENVKIPYPVIQINIRRCHSDGCDTRIRGIKAVGYRVLKSKGMSVGDASAVWFLSVLGATATAALPMAPHLRDLILSHTKSALSHMKPMSLSLTSPDRPVALSQNVLEEIENFLHSIVRFEGAIQPESLKILLEFSLARGNLKSIFKVLKLLYEIGYEDFPAAEIVKSLEDVQLKATKQHGAILKMSLSSCDGGHKDNLSKPENVLTDNWSSEAFLSDSGKTRVSMMFSSASSVRVKLTRLIIKVSKGAIGPSHGLVFVLDDFKRNEKEKEQEEGGGHETDLLSKYNDWTKAKYSEYVASCKGKSEFGNDDPVGFFTTEEDWDEVEVHVDRIVTGKYVVVKFLGARKESAERIGVLGVNFFGYEVKPDCPLSDELNLNEVAPLPSSNIVEGSTLFIRILLFLDEMAKDQIHLKSRPKNPPLYKEKEGQLEMSSVSLELVWEVYTLVTRRGVKHKKIIVSCLLLLRLFYQSLPCLKSNLRELAADSSDKTAFEKQQELSSKVFAHLCDVVDDNEGYYDEKIHQISKLIILEGAEIFFPDSKTRRSHLLSMVDQVMEEKKAASLGLTFESLCRFFSNKDASGLLGLPDIVTERGFDCGQVLAVMTTLLSVAYQESLNCVTAADDGNQSESTSNLVQLLCAMQRSLLTWCSTQMKSGSSFGQNVATDLIIEYVGILANRVFMSLQAVNDASDQLVVIDRLEHSYVAAAMRQLVLFLNLFTNVDSICMPVLRHLQPVSLELKKCSNKYPQLFFKIDSEEWNKTVGQTVLRTWQMESAHNYENNLDVKMVFNCPGCSEFTVDFDARCETERRYDYLEFTDSNGNKKRFDQKVDTEKWPKSYTFKAGNRLLFNFHSDGSNNEWGYKFTVTAKGSPDVALSWIFDLQLGMARLFGQLCSAALDSRKASPTLSDVDNEEEIKLLQSEIWTTLFRGGYMTGKLQRSLSGHHATTASSVENSVNSFLHGFDGGDNGAIEELINRCREKAPGPFIGGPLVDQAVKSAFAALIWHSQELRDQIVLFANNTPPESVPEGVQEAYITAESLRRGLVDRRQRLILQAEEESSQDSNSLQKINPDSQVIACKEKAQFLLKFAGLQRITDKTCEGRENRRSKWLNRKSSWQRTSGEHSGSILSGPRQRTLSIEEIKTIDKHPAFKLILDFVTNDSYSHERIQALLQQRVKHANNVADIYLFAADFLRISSETDLVQAPAVLFLQQFLASQKFFPRHYADNLDGCGLHLENKVRRAYYALVRRCLEGVKSYHTQASIRRPSSAAFECLRAFVLHLLDTDWKGYDYTFILDVHLPEFLLDTAKATVLEPKQDVKDMNEQQELDHYEEGNGWLQEAKRDISWFSRLQNEAQTDQERRRMHLFVARFSDILDVSITCDGCDVTLSGRRYRCLNCMDVDLCNTCYLSGVKPEGHTDSHDVIDMRFKCDECQSFIVGTRFHCNECTDFDLCFGCHSFGKFPPRHSATHKMTKFPLKTGSLLDTSANDPASRVQLYTHHHAWLQFTALALTLANFINEPNKSVVSLDYLRTAGHLHMDCLSLVTKCLSHACFKAQTGEDGTECGASSGKEVVSVSAHESIPEGESTHDVEGAATINTAAVATAVAATASADVMAIDKDACRSSGDEPHQAEAKDHKDTAAVMEEKVLTEGISEVDTNTAGGDGTNEGVVINEGPSSESKVEGSATRQDIITQTIEDVETLFASKTHERLLGLLGAVLPQDSKFNRWTSYCSGVEEFISDKFLPTLFKIIRDGECDDKTKALALGILGKFLQCTSPVVSDRGVSLFYTLPVKTESEISNKEGSSGNATVEFLFHLGAEYLARSDLNASSCMASTLQQLASSSHWQPSVADYVGMCLERLAQPTENVDLSALFGLLVFARFPDFVRMGSVVEMKDPSGEKRRAVVFKYYLDKGSVTVIDVKSRKRKTVKEHLLEESSSLSETFKTSRFSVLLDIVVKILHLLKDKKTVPVERMWVLYLGLKGLLGNIKANSSLSLNSEMVASGIVPLLVNIACQGTTFSSQWILRDLEVLSLKLYKSERFTTPSPSKPAEKDESKTPSKTSQEAEPTTNDTSATVETTKTNNSVKEEEEGGGDPFEGLDDITKTCFETIYEAMNVPCSVLRAIYENVEHDQSRLLEEVQRGFDGAGFQVSDEVREQAKKWVAIQKKPDVNSAPGPVVDVGVVRYTTSEILPKNVQAKAEQSEAAQKLIPSLSDAEIEETREKQARTKSAELLKKELESEENLGSTEYLTKVNLALSVIYSRHLIAILLGQWPQGHVITSELMDNSDEVQFIGLLDILQRLENKELFEKVVSSVVRCGDPKLVHPLSLAAAHCMGEVTLSTETRESEHKYPNDTVNEGKVHIPGAATLFVKFDPRCSTEDGCDELRIASSADYEQNKHVFSGPSSRWIDLEIPGDTLYYIFTSDSSTNDWGWKFVVTGGQLGRFKTGFTMLNAMLSLDNKVARSLPIKTLWVWLVSVACCQTGQQRLMATGLLLRLLLVVSGQVLERDGSCSVPMETSDRPDLSLLRPLWSLYTSMLEKEGGSGSVPTLVSPVLRGLTELFLMVENLAQDWGTAEDLVVGFTTNESLKRCFSQAVQKVGLIGLAIGQTNKASEALIKAASNPQPKADESKKEKSKVDSSVSFQLPFPITIGGDDNEDDTTGDGSSDDSDDSSSSDSWN
ncbi:zinc finger ZZ-type and EF-hand domain-containing protein 1-like isoform X1 [Pocillopora damicornis]|uniref:zinc finger ZZ-type and EF-hand domain-containing protein 1-like isoform X1 n=1 Tax=Pocillopora damicornis TaxID=46731 RepID=UPI000F552229|nr:zinc finger ZZ-type and EF-hand domain-containing protein 1-like isoform X1 [Pocillopora damicornis]